MKRDVGDVNKYDKKRHLKINQNQNSSLTLAWGQHQAYKKELQKKCS